MENLLTTPTSQLILAERKAQIAKWAVPRPGKQHLEPTDWLLILNEEMGELAKAMWEKKNIDHMIEEAVQVAAVAVQIAEWVSERVGWENSSEEVLLKSVEFKKPFTNWPARRLYVKMISEVGSLAFHIDHNHHQFLSRWSEIIRILINNGYLLINELSALKVDGYERLDASAE
ncbi:hypothetical protein [uncultured Fibrella sp.]|uniref:hypothetical protein n=1 Tax=uncultured Fibrella sp. TaxID=1284596 RepID=UPI0035CCA13A